MEQEQRIEKLWFMEASLIIPLAIFIAYLWALSYEIAFCRYFEIPYHFISINPAIVLMNTTAFIYFIDILAILILIIILC